MYRPPPHHHHDPHVEALNFIRLATGQGSNDKCNFRKKLCPGCDDDDGNLMMIMIMTMIVAI